MEKRRTGDTTGEALRVLGIALQSHNAKITSRCTDLAEARVISGVISKAVTSLGLVDIEVERIDRHRAGYAIEVTNKKKEFIIEDNGVSFKATLEE